MTCASGEDADLKQRKERKATEASFQSVSKKFDGDTTSSSIEQFLECVEDNNHADDVTMRKMKKAMTPTMSPAQ